MTHRKSRLLQSPHKRWCISCIARHTNGAILWDMIEGMRERVMLREREDKYDGV